LTFYFGEFSKEDEILFLVNPVASLVAAHLAESSVVCRKFSPSPLELGCWFAVPLSRLSLRDGLTAWCQDFHLLSLGCPSTSSTGMEEQLCLPESTLCTSQMFIRIFLKLSTTSSLVTCVIHDLMGIGYFHLLSFLEERFSDSTIITNFHNIPS